MRLSGGGKIILELQPRVWVLFESTKYSHYDAMSIIPENIVQFGVFVQELSCSQTFLTYWLLRLWPLTLKISWRHSIFSRGSYSLVSLPKSNGKGPKSALQPDGRNFSKITIFKKFSEKNYTCHTHEHHSWKYGPIWGIPSGVIVFTSIFEL